MVFIKRLWRKLTHTKALEQSSGPWETLFFESVYRVTYIAGWSLWDCSFGYLLYSTIVRLLMGYVVFGTIWYSLTESPNLDEFVVTMNAAVLQVITLYRYQNLINNKHFYRSLAMTMDSPHFEIATEKRRKLVEEWAQTSEKYLIRLLGLGTCTLTAWNIFPLLDDVEYNHIIAIRLPFDYKSPELYPVAYIIVVISFAYMSYFVMGTDAMMQAYLIHLLCQFTVLADRFENSLNDCVAEFEGLTINDLINNKEFVDKYKKRLRGLVEQHKFILSHTMNLRRILSGPMLGQFAASGTLICFIGYQTATTIGVSISKCLMSCLFLSYNVFELYIICKWSQEITNWSEKIGEAMYFSGWECGVCNIRGVRSIIMFVIARANKPLVLTAGGMYNLSIASYGSLVKGSYSALTMLLRFRRG